MKPGELVTSSLATLATTTAPSSTSATLQLSSLTMSASPTSKLFLATLPSTSTSSSTTLPTPWVCSTIPSTLILLILSRALSFTLTLRLGIVPGPAPTPLVPAPHTPRSQTPSLASFTLSSRPPPRPRTRSCMDSLVTFSTLIWMMTRFSVSRLRILDRLRTSIKRSIYMRIDMECPMSNEHS